MAFELTLWAVYVVVIEEIGTNWAVPNINVATSKTRNFLGPVKDYSLPLHSIEEHDESGRSWFKHQNGKLSVYEHPWNYMDVLATGGNASLSAPEWQLRNFRISVLRKNPKFPSILYPNLTRGPTWLCRACQGSRFGKVDPCHQAAVDNEVFMPRSCVKDWRASRTDSSRLS